MILARNVGRCDHGKLRPVDFASEFNRPNQPTRNRRAYRSPVPHTLALDIVHIARAAQQLIHPFFPEGGGAYDAGFRMRAHGWEAASGSYRLRHSIQRRRSDAKPPRYSIDWLDGKQISSPAQPRSGQARGLRSRSTPAMHIRLADD